MYSSGVTLRKPYGCTLVKGMRVPCVYSMFGVARDTSSSRSARCTLCLELPGRLLPAWSDLGRLVPLPRAPACFLVCEPSGCRARSVFGRRVISYIGATVDWALITACPLRVFTACSHCVFSLRGLTACNRSCSGGLQHIGVASSVLCRSCLVYSMFGVARAYSAVRRWSCLCVLYVWSCQAYSRSEGFRWTPALELLVRTPLRTGVTLCSSLELSVRTLCLELPGVL